MKPRPIADPVIVKRMEKETKRASGPGKSNDKGEVKALSVKVGDRVLFGKYSGQTVKLNGEELLVMKEDDLFAVVEQ